VTKWATFSKPYDHITSKAKNGAIRGMVAYKASEIPVPLPEAHLKAAVAGGYATEVDAPDDKGTTKSGQVQDKAPTAPAVTTAPAK
jgi:hypothetical protein